jgi:hypothetical protein
MCFLHRAGGWPGPAGVVKPVNIEKSKSSAGGRTAGAAVPPKITDPAA